MAADMILPGMQKTEEEHRRDICVAGRWIFERGYVAATDGNISVRLDSGESSLRLQACARARWRPKT